MVDDEGDEDLVDGEDEEAEALEQNFKAIIFGGCH